MHAPLAATLIVLFGHGTAMACEYAGDASGRPGTTPLLIAQSHVQDPMLRTATDAPALGIGPVAGDAPVLMRTAGRPEPIARFAPLEERPVVRNAAPAAPAAAAETDRGNGATLLLVGLALMAGIAMRRMGAGRP